MNYYVKKQDNSQYLQEVSLENKEGFVEVYVNDEQLVKLINFTDKCYLNENDLLIVPDQVSMSDQELERQKMVNQINTLKGQLIASDNAAKDKQQQIDDLNNRIGQLMLAIAKQPQGGNK